MNILEKGRLPADQIFRGRCTNCNCLIECTSKEIVHDLDEDGGVFGERACPTDGCDYIIRLRILYGREGS